MTRYRIPLLTQLLRTLITAPVTVGFPFGPANIPEGFRGRVIINEENCVGCSMCVRDCPTAALELKRTSKKEYQLIYRPDRCAYCGQCELSCKFDAIHLDADYLKATPDRESLKVILVDRKEEEA
ncbi:MAG: 4Fe-4S binding protein [Anaerolineae bacterium]|nr:4Fe-4S binding protein [Anaerolineae bacterium]